MNGETLERSERVQVIPLFREHRVGYHHHVQELHHRNQHGTVYPTNKLLGAACLYIIVNTYNEFVVVNLFIKSFLS
jgi:hypothetical protein